LSFVFRRFLIRL